jgi:menaquinol-cytochrome c reductase iron-sulfur subunit
MATSTEATVSRRRFLEWLAGGLVFLGVLWNAVPFVGALASSPAGAAQEGFTKVGPVSALAGGDPKNLTFQDTQQDAYIHQTVTRSVWAVQRSGGAVVVYSPVCPHLGCQATWVASEKRFVCPCHNSIWTINGALVSGPSPRNLDTLPSRVENGELFVKWEQFELGVPQKIPIA